MKTLLILLLAISITGCSTTDVKQTNTLSVDYFRPDGSLERRESRNINSTISASGDGNATVSKLKAAQSKSGVMSLGTEGSESEITSPVAMEGMKSLFAFFEMMKTMAAAAK